MLLLCSNTLNNTRVSDLVQVVFKLFLHAAPHRGLHGCSLCLGASQYTCHDCAYSVKVVAVSRLSDRLNELNTDELPLREIADRAKARGWKISFTTVRSYLNGTHPENPPARALNALAAAFDVPVEDLEAAAHYTGRAPFEPDSDADLLTAKQRAAVNEIIRLLADGNRNTHATPDSPLPSPQEPDAQVQDEGEKTGPTPDELELARRARETPPEEIDGMAAKRKISSENDHPGNES